MSQSHTEIEVRFLEINIAATKRKLKELAAIDLGEDFLREIIFYDQAMTWRDQRKFVRMRQTKNGIIISYKHKPEQHSIDVEEIEIKVNDWNNTKILLENIGLVAYREQEKKRHTFQMDSVTVDIDTWPSLPSYVELEGPSESELKEAAKKLELRWDDAVFAGAGYVIEQYYHIPVTSLKYFTFDRIE